MENAGYLFAAFAIVWALVFAYMVVLFNRQKRLQSEIESLKKSLTDRRVQQ